MSQQHRFPLGTIVKTSTADRAIPTEAMVQALQRHARGDWGDCPPEDKAMNDQALLEGGRLHSSYKHGSTPFWIITEWDRSVTTVLLPEDY